jgi:DNA-binding CsgD family transcriptional regulator
MRYSDQCCARPQVESLMQFAVALSDLTSSLTLGAEIPALLRNALELEALTLAIIREESPGTPAKLFFRSTAGLEPTSHDTPLDEQVLVIYEQTKSGQSSAYKPVFDDSQRCVACSEMAIQRLGSFPKASVLARLIDDHDCLLLVIHHRVDDPPLSERLCEMLPLIANQLARLLDDLIAWHFRPQEFGAPFNRLTQREWMVLRGLNSEVGEKQLADNLGLSPHTLHSHIKSIYRKVDVQGRLPLLAKIHAAFRALRSARLATSDNASDASGTTAAAAG